MEDPSTPPPADAEAGAVPDIEDLGFGSVEVTDRCIGAMACRVLAPEVFKEARGDVTKAGNFTYAVGRPILDETEYRQVRRAVAACPKYAIRMRRGAKAKALDGIEDVNAAYPFPVNAENEVYLLGFYSPKNAGATCYLIRRPKGGNVMVDGPKPDPELVKRVKELGGAAYLVFTHKDHTAFFKDWAEALPGIKRVLHAKDVVSQADHAFFPCTAGVETQLAGAKPQPLDAERDVVLIPVPGHTPGSICLLYREHYLFTGDVLFWSEPKAHLAASRVHCWGDWREQTGSLASLEAYQWKHVLPGHGDPRLFSSVAEAHEALRRGVEWCRRQPGGHTSFLRFLPWISVRTRNDLPRWAKWVGEALLAPVGAPGTYLRERAYAALRLAVALWAIYRFLPRALRYVQRMRVGGGAGCVPHCRLVYSAQLLMNGAGKGR